MRTLAAKLTLAALAASPLFSQAGRWTTLDGKPPLVIGHRGASGYLPEHTLQSYRRAIELGADFIEPDLVSTKDGQLIARHEPLLDGTTNVASLPEFAPRKATRNLDGVSTTGFWASDFTLEEIKRIRAVQSNAARDQGFNGRFEIPTLEEIIELVQGESVRRGRSVGIYPETKHPTFHFAIGLPLEEALLRTLSRYGLTQKNSPVIVQSFEVANLRYLRTRTSIRLVQLIDADDVAMDGSLTFAAPYDKPYDYTVIGDPRGFFDLATKPANLAEIKKYADGIGPWKRYIVSVRGVDANGDKKADDINGDGSVNDSDKPATTPSNLIKLAHEAGLFVHAYTFRNERGTLSGSYGNNPVNEYVQYFTLGVDGVFSDFPDTAIEGRTAAEALPKQ